MPVGWCEQYEPLLRLARFEIGIKLQLKFLLKRIVVNRIDVVNFRPVLLIVIAIEVPSRRFQYSAKLRKGNINTKICGPTKLFSKYLSRRDAFDTGDEVAIEFKIKLVYRGGPWNPLSSKMPFSKHLFEINLDHFSRFDGIETDAPSKALLEPVVLQLGPSMAKS